jgi:hypothetical protein
MILIHGSRYPGARRSISSGFEQESDHDMHMVRRDMSLQDIAPRLLTLYAPNDADPFCDLTAQYLMAILSDPDNIEVS